MGIVTSDPYASYGSVFFSIKLDEKIEGIPEEIAVIGRVWNNLGHSAVCLRKNDKVTVYGNLSQKKRKYRKGYENKKYV